MNCKRALKYIYLQKEITLSTKEQKDFEEHVANCANCKEEFAKAGNYFSTLSNLQFDENTVNSETFSSNVINTISKQKERITEQLLDSLQHFLVMPAIRYAIAASILLICLAYFSEEYRGLHKINLLEDKFSAISNRQLLAGNDLSSNAKELQDLITGEKQYLKLPGSWVLMKETDLIKKIEELSNQPGAELLLNKQNDLQLLLNHPEVKKVIEKDDELKKIFNRVMPEGAVSHEN